MKREHEARVSQDKVLRRILGPGKEVEI